MSSLFGFMDMIGNEEERKVARHEGDGLLVDTCYVTDSEQDYETAVSHARYNEGRWVIVEVYDTEAQAQKGHSRWVKTMTANELPLSLKDVSTALIAATADAFSGDDSWREYQAD